MADTVRRRNHAWFAFVMETATQDDCHWSFSPCAPAQPHVRQDVLTGLSSPSRSVRTLRYYRTGDTEARLRQPPTGPYHQDIY